jgi:chromosome segregation ATPase
MEQHAQATIAHSEGSPWFWKLFGGGIMGLIGVLLMLVINSLNINVTSVRSDLMNITTQQKTETEIQITRLKDELGGMNAKIASLEEFKASTKENLASIEKDIKDASKALESAVGALKDHDKEVDGNVIALREKLLSLEEKVVKMSGDKETK